MLKLRVDVFTKQRAVAHILGALLSHGALLW